MLNCKNKLKFIGISTVFLQKRRTVFFLSCICSLLIAGQAFADPTPIWESFLNNDGSITVDGGSIVNGPSSYVDGAIGNAFAGDGSVYATWDNSEVGTIFSGWNNSLGFTVDLFFRGDHWDSHSGDSGFWAITKRTPDNYIIASVQDGSLRLLFRDGDGEYKYHLTSVSLDEYTTYRLTMRQYDGDFEVYLDGGSYSNSSPVYTASNLPSGYTWDFVGSGGDPAREMNVGRRGCFTGTLQTGERVDNIRVYNGYYAPSEIPSGQPDEPKLYNGDWEYPDISTYQYDPSGSDWDHSGNGYVIANTGSAFNNTAYSGSQNLVLQGVVNCSQPVDGFEVGSTYKINWAEASRPTYGGNNLRVLIDTTVVDALHTVTDTSWSEESSDEFTATSAIHTLKFDAQGGAGGDRSVFIDAITIEKVIPSLPGAATSPSPANSADDVSNDATLSWTAGSGTVSHDVYFGLDATPDLGEFQGNQSGTTFDPGTLNGGNTYYWRIDEVNAAGTTTGTTWSFTTISALTIFNTGVDSEGDALGDQVLDPHWTLTTSADSTYDGPELYTCDSDTWPLPSPWLANTSDSMWICPRQDATQVSPGAYVYQLQFDLTGYDPDTAAIDGRLASDDSLTNIKINGVSTNISESGFDSWDDFDITDDFQSGTNTLEFFLNNGGSSANPSALRVEMTLTADAIDNPPGAATNPNPASGATNVSVDADLSWTAGSAATSHDVYFGTDSTPDSGESKGNQAGTTYSPATMDNDTIHYWRIDEVNAYGTTTGTVWSFTTIIAAPAQASNPTPADGASSVSVNADLSWTAGARAASHDVYFGETSPGSYQGNQSGTSLEPGTLDNDTTYYWRIDEVNAAGTTTGIVWSFTTVVGGSPPGAATNPSPSNSATGVAINADLSWTAGSGATSHDVYFGQSSPGTFQGNQGGTTFDTGTMTNNTTYYWRIDEVNAYGTTTGTGWSFTTIIAVPGQASNPSPANSATGVATAADLSWTAGSNAASHDVYFGEDSTPDTGEFQGNQAGVTYDPGTLSEGTTYYWRIDELNAAGTTTGTVWSFTTATTTADIEKGPYLLYPGVNSQMTVLWQLDGTASCTLEWGLDTSYSAGSTGTTQYGDDHQHKHNITGLTPGMKYYYRVTIGANQYTGTFRAAPSDVASKVKILAYGDTRSYPANQAAVCEEMIDTFTADSQYQTLTLLSGDWVNAGETESDWTDQFFSQSYSDLLDFQANMPINGCLGNHEWDSGSSPETLMDKYWPYPFEDNYYWSFDYGPVHVAVIDQYGASYSSGSDQYNWLVSDLDNTDKEWKIILLHEPGYSSGGGHSNNTTVQTYIQPLCETYGVDLVIAGHNHYYSRHDRNGVKHITTGGGGAPLYTPNTGSDYWEASSENYHFCKIDIDGTLLDFEAVKYDGTVLDSFTIDHNEVPLVISALSPSTYEVKYDDLDEGKLMFADRDHTFTDVPAAYEQQTYIKTENDDKASSGDSFVTFNVNQDCTVYVAHDDRITSKPSWMSSFTDSGDDLTSSDNSNTFSLYYKDFDAGQVTLGGNGGTSSDSMYSIVVFGKGTGEPAAPDLLNWSFEYPDVDGYEYYPSGSDWTRTGNYVIADSGSAWGGDAYEGNQYAVLQQTASISQSVSGFVVGKTYMVRWAEAARPGGGGNDMRVLIDTTVVGTLHTITNTNWAVYTSDSFTATSTSHTIKFDALNTAGGDRSVFIDAVQITGDNPTDLTTYPGWNIYTPGDYRYGPSIIINSDDSMDAWFAAMGSGGVADVIKHKKSTDGGESWGSETTVLEPTPSSADYWSCCDPGVVKFGGYYYIGYTAATNNDQAEDNEVYVARSTSPTSGFQKWNGNGWGGNPQAFITYDGDNWGSGEPSFVAKNGTLYIYYTVIDPYWKTHLATASTSDPNWPGNVTLQGVAFNREYAEDSADVKYIDEKGKFIAVCVKDRFTNDSSIQVRESADGINWSLSDNLTDYIQLKAHNCGISGTAEGHIDLNDDNVIAYAHEAEGDYWGHWHTHMNPIDYGPVGATPPEQASSPTPANSATSVGLDADLSWTAGERAVSHDVYFGEDSTPDTGEFQGNQTGITYDPGTMDASTTYYWRIDEVNGAGTTTGTVWSFTTTSGPTALVISNVSPTSYEVSYGDLDEGELMYADRTHTFTDVPDIYEQETYIKTDNDDKASTGTSFVTFTINQDCTVYVAHDDRISSKPSWMSSFTDTGYHLTSSDNSNTFSMYSKSFASGQVALGGNYGDVSRSMYSIVVVPIGSTPPYPASNPSPSNGATGVWIDADLSWTAGAGATSHNVYFGQSSPGTFQGNQAGTTYDPGTLAGDTTYYWRIDELNSSGTTTGTVWSFTTGSGAADIGISLSGHYITYNGQTIMLIGDSGTQCGTQNSNLNHRQWIDDCYNRGIRAIHVWGLLEARQKQDGSVKEDRWGYVYPDLVPWARNTSGSLANDQRYDWNLTQYDEGSEGDFTHYWPRMRDMASYAKSKNMLLGITLFPGWTKYNEDWAYHPFNSNNGGHLTNKEDAVIIDTPGTEVWQQTWSGTWANDKKTQWIWEKYAIKMINDLGSMGNVFFVLFDEHSYSDGNLENHFADFFRSRGMIWVDQDAMRSNVDIVMSGTFGGDDKNDEAVSGFNDSPARPYMFLEGHPYMGDGVREAIWTFSVGGGNYFFHADQDQETVTTGIMGYDPYVPNGDKGMYKRDWLGYASTFFNEYVEDLDSMTPQNGLVGSGADCLANAGTEYAVYSKSGYSSISVNLSAASGKTMDCYFYDPRDGIPNSTFQRSGGSSSESFTKPSSDDWILHIIEQ